MKVAFIVPDNRDEFRKYEDPDPYFGPAPTALLEGFEMLADECEIHVVCCTKRPMRSPAQIGRNIFYYSLQVGKWGWLRGSYIGCIFGIRAYLRQLQPHIVHGQGTERYCGLAAAFCGFPNVITIHGNMRRVATVYRARPFTFYWLAARLETLTIPITGGVFCNSRHTEEAVVSLAKRTWRVPNALRETFFSSPFPERRRKERPVILNLGLVTENKQQVALLELAERLWEQGADFELQFAGGMERQSAYTAKFHDLLQHGKFPDRVRYLGNRSLPELIEAIDQADALIHCAIEESFGLVVAEALARNLKFFGMSSGGVVDIATGVEGAEIFAANNWDELGAALRSWIMQGFPRPTNAALEMHRRYHPRRIAEEHLRIYRQILGRD